MPASESAVPLTSFVTFGELLKYLRRRAQLTQRDLSIAVGYSEAQISRIESNKRPPDLTTLAARFVPALQLQDQPAEMAQLLALAAAARGEAVPASLAVRRAAASGAGEPLAVRHNLPLALTSFIGREREIAEVRRLLSTTRLLTLTGAGGCGKTRLALEAAAQLGAEFPDGIWLVELVPLSEPELVVRQAAATFGVRERPRRELAETLADALRGRRLLLLLDNCEHLVEACARLAEGLLRRCPELCILATSREALGVPGETGWLVPSLSLPKLQTSPDHAPGQVEAVQQSEAVRLFVERAVTAKPDFGLTETNAQAVAHVCRRLDGIPLAIELAAARVRLLRAEQIAARLDDRFALLTGGGRSALPRHQTLRALIDWSYDLLPEPERAMFRRLAVFAGGFTLAAATAVCSQNDEGGMLNDELHRSTFTIHRSNVLDLLTQLVNKSLVTVERPPGGEARYSMLETIRQYGHDRLQETGKEEQVRARHLNYFMQLAEAAEEKLHATDQPLWLKRLETERDNLRAALEWALGGQKANAEAGLRLGGALKLFWNMHSTYIGEGRTWLERELTRSRPQRAAQPGSITKARAKALNAAGVLAYHQGDFAAANALERESVNIYRSLGDRLGVAQSLFELGYAILFQDDPKAARTAVVESVAIFREVHDMYGLGSSLAALGMAEYACGDLAAARLAYEESLAALDATGESWTHSMALTGLGRLALRRGEYAEARARFEAALAIRREFDDKFLVAYSLNYLAVVARRQGEYRQAESLLRESLTLSRETGNHHSLAMSLAAFGSLAADEGQPGRAAQLSGAAESLLERIGAVMVLTDPADLERTIALGRAQLGEAGFAAAWAEGRAMTLEQAVAYALEG